MIDRLIDLLLVEDNTADAAALIELLSETDAKLCRVARADRLSEAERKARETAFDLVLLDLSLPDSAGIATIERAREAMPSVPIVVLTGPGDDETAMRAMKAGALDYLVKGEIDATRLARTLRYALERRHAARVEGERRALQVALRGMDEVLGVVAHDLRIPLASLATLTGMLARGEVSPPEKEREMLRAAHREVLRMSDMVTNLLESARLKSGAARWTWSTCSAAGVVRDAIDAVRPLVEPGVTLDGAATPEDLSFKGDKDAVRRLLVNLLANAAKHTGKGSIRVTASEESAGGVRWINWTVSDTGKGMPREVFAQLGRAFALNSGVIGSEKFSGAGLGLAICARIAAAHAGDLRAGSEPDKGTRITARLRADLDRAVEQSGPASRSRAARPG